MYLAQLFILPAFISSLRLSQQASLRGAGPDRFVVVFMTHGNTNYFEKSLRSFLSSKHRENFPAFVSLDAPEAFSKVDTLVRNLESEFRLPAHSAIHEIVVKPADGTEDTTSQRKIDNHVFFALRTALEKSTAPFIVFLEDDLVLSPDFLQFMLTGSSSLETDKSLFCLSAWNNQAAPGEDKDPRRLIRSSVFPGLGWMMHRDTVQELVTKWPGAYHASWDGWFSRPDTAAGRECIAPELARTHHIGAHGVHVENNAEYDALPHADIPADPNTFDFSQVRVEQYDTQIRKLLASAKTVPVESLSSAIDERNAIFLIPIMNADGEKIEPFFQHFCPWCMAHHGLIVRRKPETNSTFVFVHKTRGADWLNADLRVATALHSAAHSGDMWDE